MPEPRAIVAALPEPLEHLKIWRHVIQCAFQEERARVLLEAAEEFAGAESAAARSCEAKLDVHGARLNAALFELHELLTTPTATTTPRAVVTPPVTAPPGALPDPTLAARHPA